MTHTPRSNDVAGRLSGDVAVRGHAGGHVRASDERRRWAQSLIRRADAATPGYGSAAWLALADGDHAKIAAVVIAAECWARDGDDLADRLADEVRRGFENHKRLDDEEYRERAEAHRRTWRRENAITETVARRQKQRREWLQRKPRPGDFKGRGSERE
jgi:hypothetical protein